MLRERRIRFIRESRGNDFLNAGFSRGISQFSRINAVPGNDAEDGRYFHVSILTRRAKLSIFINQTIRIYFIYSFHSNASLQMMKKLRWRSLGA